MKYQFRILIILAISFAIILSVTNSVIAHDRSEADACEGCHFYPGNVIMQFYVPIWKTSYHGETFRGNNANTYCAQCHSPFEADPLAIEGDSDPVPFESWQDVTCGACHPPHDLRVEWGTPIGLYDINTGGWIPVYPEQSNDLCSTNCHAGNKHLVDFKAVGKLMFEKKAVLCVDCHLPKVPNTEDPGRFTRSHSLSVEANLPWSCGIEGENSVNCHQGKTEHWAEKQINKMKIHGKNKNKK